MRKFVTRIATVASLTLAAVPALGLTQAASAAPREPVARVAFGDLNLSQPAQAAIFKARVDAAGEKLCRERINAGLTSLPLRGCMGEVHREVDRQLSDNQRQALTVAARASASQMAAR
ncbi:MULTISPECIES: UrcA family protein [Caulobacter]|jgi:UrcA family protein|uniref:UrcA family protein n=1 Tax=Caulobacter vibrioides OR37 TaxID=1292034 RepID=R0EMT5_CAUVI|nr:MULTISPECIES: UrcA family protein [Caulobacter]ENZ83179.1 hypothetical protein OR37_00954 [Caulobacter vibrioides OR37]MBQ1561885.1 UrcA family protein [Caulobacter sp.]